MKKLVKVLVILGILLSIVTQVVQATSFKFSTTPNEITVKRGETIKIDLKLSEIDVGEEGINTFECMLKYDEQIFEDVKIETKNNWSITYNNQKNNKNYGKMLAVLLSTGVTEDQEIGTVILKVKEDANAEVGDITFTQASSSDGKVIIPTSDQTVKINIKGSISNSDKTNGNNTSTNNQNSYEGKKTAKNLESQIRSYMYYIIAFGVCMIVIIIFVIIKFVRNNKNKENE